MLYKKLTNLIEFKLSQWKLTSATSPARTDDSLNNLPKLVNTVSFHCLLGSYCKQLLAGWLSELIGLLYWIKTVNNKIKIEINISDKTKISYEQHGIRLSHLCEWVLVHFI